MAYNTYFPTGYQPQTYYPQTQSQTPNTGITWVQGEAGAKSYLIAPNTTVTLWDSEAQVIYLKSADASGMPSIKTLDYTIRDNSRFEGVSERYNDFATKSDVEDVRKEVEALTERFTAMTKKGGSEDE